MTRPLGLTFLLAIAFSTMVAQQTAPSPSASNDPQITWEFDSGG
jgi:hypothetical protein